MDSDDLDFLQFAATALDLGDEEYSALLNELDSEEFREESTLDEDEEEDREFYRLARGDWDDWLEADTWYELSAEYEEH